MALPFRLGSPRPRRSPSVLAVLGSGPVRPPPPGLWPLPGGVGPVGRVVPAPGPGPVGPGPSRLPGWSAFPPTTRAGWPLGLAPGVKSQLCLDFRGPPPLPAPPLVAWLLAPCQWPLPPSLPYLTLGLFPMALPFWVDPFMGNNSVRPLCRQQGVSPYHWAARKHKTLSLGSKRRKTLSRGSCECKTLALGSILKRKTLSLGSQERKTLSLGG